MNKVKHSILILLISLLFVACKTTAPQKEEVVILSLNDIHAQIDNFDKIVAYIEEQRELQPNLLLLSAGDLFTGNPIVDYHENKGYPIIELMNKAGFNASTIGNHDFDYGLQVLSDRMKQANFPFLCANINTSGTPIKQPQAFKIFDISGIKIAVLGFTQENPDIHAARVKGLSFSSPSNTFAKYSFLRDSCNIFIALTHIGLAEDLVLASQYSEIDLIVGAHTHDPLDSGRLINKTLVTQAGENTKHIGHTHIKLENGKIISMHNKLVDVSMLTKKDAKTSKIIKSYKNNPHLNKTIGKLSNPIDTKFNIGNLFCDAIKHHVEADVVFQNVNGIRIENLPSGNIKIKDIYQADPFDNEIIVFNLSGSQLTNFIADNYDRFKQLDLCVSGLCYTVFADERSRTHVKLTTPEGQPLSLNKRYKVAMNGYMAKAYSVPTNNIGKNIGVSTVDAITKYIENKRTIVFDCSETRGSIVIK